MVSSHQYKRSPPPRASDSSQDAQWNLQLDVRACRKSSWHYCAWWRGSTRQDNADDFSEVPCHAGGTCCALRNLTCCSIGKAKFIESGGIEVFLDAVTTHSDSAFLCQQACWALLSIASDSKENTRLLVILGGGAAVAKVSTKWRDDGSVQTQVRAWANLIASEMQALTSDE